MKKKVKPSDVLKRAKMYLWSGVGNKGTPFICGAISRAGDVLKADDVALMLRKKIHKALHPALSIRTWLEDVHGVEPWTYSSSDLQEHRRLWLDKMIADFEKAGK